MLTDTAVEIQSLLEPRERLVWSGTPRRGVFLRRSDLLAIPTGVLLAGFALIWEIGALLSDAPVFFPIFGIPFVIIGLYHLIGRFFHDAAKRKRTLYGVTDRRVIIVSKLFTDSVTSIPIDQIPQLTLSRHRNGRGTIIFGPEGRLTDQLPFNPNSEQSPRFDQIEHPAHVHRLIREAMNESA